MFRGTYQRPFALDQVLPAQAFFQADETLVADDEVIDQFDVEVVACGDELLGDGDIFG